MSVAFDRAAVFEAGLPACSSSSLGKDSDDGSTMGKGEEADEGEVQSAYTEVGFTGLGALEESLPIRRGISKFYNGKSRSFTFLREAISLSGSSRDIAKADNAYTRKRKNLLAYSIIYDKSQHTVPETDDESGTRKRLARWSNATLSLRPLDSISSSRSSSHSSISSEENELPQEFTLGQSPDNTTNFAAPMIPVSLLGSCKWKMLSTPTRSSSMLDLHRLHRSGSSVHLKDKQKVE